MTTTLDRDTHAYDQRILHAFRRIIRNVDLYSRQLAAHHDVTGPQLLCLLTLAEHGSMTSAHLARHIHVSPSTIVGIVDRLEDKKLLTRHRTREDRRQVLLKLTPQGKRVASRAPSPLQERFAVALQQLPAREQATLARALERVVGLMEPDHA